MRTTRTVALATALLLLALPLAACATTSTGTGTGTAPDQVVPEPAPGAALDTDGTEPAAAEPQVARDVIRTASVTVVVADPEASGEQITQATKNSGGYVAQVSTVDTCEGGVCPSPDTPVASGAEPEASSSLAVQGAVLTMTVRVPAAKYDAVLASIQELGEVAALNVTADDVTAEVVDLDARIESQRASVARMRDLLRQANTIAEMVRVEGELAQRQADLESMISQRKQLADQVALATITAALVPQDSAEAVLPAEDHWWDAAWKAFTESWSGLLVALAAISPLLILGGVVGALVLLVLRHRRPRARNVSAEDAAPAEESDAAR